MSEMEQLIMYERSGGGGGGQESEQEQLRGSGKREWQKYWVKRKPQEETQQADLRCSGRKEEI